MQSANRRGPPQRVARIAGRRRLWPVLAPAGVLVLLAAGWCITWYYAAGAADRAIAGWLDREAKAGRVYSCGEQTIGGFPFRIEVRCTDAGADIAKNEPPFRAKAKGIVIAAEVYHPTLLTGEIDGPLTLSTPQQQSSFVANWTLARASVRGVPPNPERLSFVFDQPRLDRITAGRSESMFASKHAEVHSFVIGGSPDHNPVIETVVRLSGATAPLLHPALAKPVRVSIDAVFTGFKDTAPKSLAQRFRELQAAGGDIKVKHLRIRQADIAIVGDGTLRLNAHGRLDGLLRVAVAGIDQLVPLLGIDRALAQSIDRLAGSSDQSSSQGLGGLARLVPGLSEVVRQNANAAIIDNVKKMGEPTEIDKKPAVALPLNFSDGSVYLGMIPLGQVPALF